MNIFGNFSIDHLGGQPTLSSSSSSRGRTGRLATRWVGVLLLLGPVDSFSLNFSIFFSKLLPFFLGGFSRKRPSASAPLARPGEGGPLREDRVLLAEEQREELLLVSWSSLVLVAVAVLAASLGLWPSLSLLLLQLLMEQTSWRSPRDTSAGPPGGGASAAGSRRRHRLVCLSKVQLGLMAQKSSSSFSSSWRNDPKNKIHRNLNSRGSQLLKAQLF